MEKMESGARGFCDLADFFGFAAGFDFRLIGDFGFCAIVFGSLRAVSACTDSPSTPRSPRASV